MKRSLRISLAFFLMLHFYGVCNPKSYGDSEDTIKIPEYLSNLIVEYGNIKVYDAYGLLEENSKYGDDVITKSETHLIRYVDDMPRDTTVLKGPYGRTLGKGKLCQITVGTDTVNIDITKRFPKYVDLRFAGVVPGCRFFRYSKHYALSDESPLTDFQINLAIPYDAPDSIGNFINEEIRDDVAGYFPSYSGDEATYPDIPLYNLKKGDYNGLIRYYYHQFRSLYQQDFSLSEEEYEEGVTIPLIWGGYSYQVYIYPVWQNSDSSLTTWKFYNYGYRGGAHGGESEYYLTFDNNTGRILGVNDFYSKLEFKKAVEALTRQLNAYHNVDVDTDNNCYSPYIEFAAEENGEESTELNEFIDGMLYPRPALTKQGMVFTYQTYEKGSFFEGVLHFAQPYKKDFKLK